MMPFMSRQLFSTKEVKEILFKVLRTSSYCKKKKVGISLSFQALCADILYRLHSDIPNWPLEFLRIYLDDALGPRVWVDEAKASRFCSGIIAWIHLAT
jgi:hypothetical protein